MKAEIGGSHRISQNTPQEYGNECRKGRIVYLDRVLTTDRKSQRPSGVSAAIQKIFPLIKAFALRQSAVGEQASLSEELVQETMVKIWQKAGSFNPKKASASTWIFTIARNTRIDLLRKTARHHQNRISNDHSEDGFDVEDIWIENEDEDAFNQLVKQRNSEMLHKSIKELPDEQEFILKRYISRTNPIPR